jgi:hypothetical protein
MMNIATPAQYRAVFENVEVLIEKTVDPGLRQLLEGARPLRIRTGQAWSSNASGGIAMVFVYATKQGRKALRVYTWPELSDRDPGLVRARFAELNNFLRSSALRDHTVPFEFIPNAVDVPGAGVCPVLLMDWVDGTRLSDYVAQRCAEDRTRLTSLPERWLELMRLMGECGLDHCDLAPGNVLVLEDGQLVLIDYDFMVLLDKYTLGPLDMAGGQPSCVHPDAQRELLPAGSRDIFPALVIYTSLLALAATPDLWWRAHPGFEPSSGPLLLTTMDLADPDDSAMFARVEQMANTRVRAAVLALREACLRPARQLPTSLDRALHPPFAPSPEPSLLSPRLDAHPPALCVRFDWPPGQWEGAMVCWSTKPGPRGPDGQRCQPIYRTQDKRAVWWPLATPIHRAYVSLYGVAGTAGSNVAEEVELLDYVEMRRPVRVTCRILNTVGARPLSLSVETDGGPLPRMAVVAYRGDTPQTPFGHQVLKWIGGRGGGGTCYQLHLDNPADPALRRTRRGRCKLAVVPEDPRATWVRVQWLNTPVLG